MLTRLKVDGFKGLVGIDLRFGPFTCIAGSNGTGKSNVFDAISFLSDLADLEFASAVARVRGDEAGRGDDGDVSRLSDVLSSNGGEVATSMRFECEFLIGPTGEDDLGQPARAESTMLRYVIELRAREEDPFSVNPLEVIEERLTYLTQGKAEKALPFADSHGHWFKSVFSNERTADYISTVTGPAGRRVKLHQDGRLEEGTAKRGRPLIERDATKLPRTVLSSVTAAESPTALLARNEFRSWRRLQLEASAMRRSDRFSAPADIGTDGSHLAKTLHRHLPSGPDGSIDEDDDVLVDMGARLGELIDDVTSISVEVDTRRERLTLMGVGRNGARYRAKSLSDGTLRFLALLILEHGQRPEVICLEEPENGIHPTRIEPMIGLLRDIAVSSMCSIPSSSFGPISRRR